MKCIYCKGDRTTVTNSRKTKGGDIVWRRRSCSKCDQLFTTREDALMDNLFIEKRNGRRQRFIYEKLFVSIFTSIDTGKGQDNGDKALISRDLTQAVIEGLRALNKKVVPTSTLIEIAHSEINKISSYYGEKYMFYSDYRISVLRKRK